MDLFFFFFNDTATTEIYTLSLHDALPIWITFINPAFTEMLYFSAEEMIGQGSHGIIHHHRADGSDYPREECPMYAAYTQGKASRIADEFLWGNRCRRHGGDG